MLGEQLRGALADETVAQSRGAAVLSPETRIADVVAMLHHGRIIAYCGPEEIQHHPDPVVQSFIRGEPDFLEA